ncbi:GlsB/YeaQ/YmgE family stress response membrane protein [Streptomyces sp. NPDC088733]|uniref:GlsB/YeaQ/YmgE family stress response membrane protein n=1 Tax=Streptomyces sp. NPDC088733 TaxID=3365880 RepID=UPI0037F64016
MEMSSIVSAVVIGLVVGVLGRLVAPGRQAIGLVWTMVAGIVAAFLGTAVAAGLGVADTEGVDWIEWLLQIALAAVGVAALARTRLGR